MSLERTRERVETVRRSARTERLRARAPRYLFASTAVVLSLLGVRELVSASEATRPTSPSTSVDHASEDFAQRFARAYLTYDGTRPGTRERALRALVPDELALDAGLVPRGSQRVLWTQISQNQEAIAGGRVIVVSAGVTTQPGPLYLAVPVYRHGDGEVGLAGYPSLVGPPAVSRAPVAERDEVDEPEIAAVARRVVANYVSGEAQNLAADLAPGAEDSLPTIELRLRSLEELVWAAGVGSSAVLATAVVRDPSGTTWTLTYELGIEQSGGRTYVTFIETVPNAP